MRRHTWRRIIIGVALMAWGFGYAVLHTMYVGEFDVREAFIVFTPIAVGVIVVADAAARAAGHGLRAAVSWAWAHALAPAARWLGAVPRRINGCSQRHREARTGDGGETPAGDAQRDAARVD